MKIVFLVDRGNLVRYLAPVMAEALQRDHQVICLLGQTSAAGDPKAHLDATEVDLPAVLRTQVESIPFTDYVALEALVDQLQPDAIISTQERGHYANYGANLSESMFVTLQVGVDTLANAGKQGAFGTSDLVCLYTPYWLDLSAEIYALSGQGEREEYYQAVEGKIAFTGAPQFDQFAKIDPQEVRQRWEIPADQPVVLVLPIPLANLSDYWSLFFMAETRAQQLKKLFWGGVHESPALFFEHFSWALRGWNDAYLNHVLGEFNQHNEAYLLVKGRKKDPVRPSLAAVADRVLYDDENDPATIFEALAIADLCIHFYSTATLEAAYAGVPALCIHRPSPFAKYGEEPPYPTRWWSRVAQGPYNFTGVNRWLAIPEAIEQLPTCALDTFKLDEQARQAYLEKYVGPVDHRASHRVLDAVEARIAQPEVMR